MFFAFKRLVKLPDIHRVLNSLLFVFPAALVQLSLALLFLLSPRFTAVAVAGLSGDFSLNYTSYEGSADDPLNRSQRKSMSSSSLSQNYSLLYSDNGVIYNNRVGRYDVALGYNWTALDTSFRASGQPDNNYKLNRGHILYKGEILLDPKEIPLRLNMYSRDMTRNSIVESTGAQIENFSSIINNRYIGTDISDGIHVESGVTLVAGVKNGMTNGFNEVLRHFPMILIDYKDTVNRDLRSLNNKVDDRLSRLAFVSLNKKDNWFHYRHTIYDDYIHKNNGYEENQFQIGTVDQHMARRWIDFSNWIKVSTDLQLTKRKNNDQKNAIEEVDLNLFMLGERKYWKTRVLTNFNRYKDENNVLSYQANLPVYTSGVYSQDVSWNTRTTYRYNRDINANGTSSMFINALIGYRVDMLKRSMFTLAQSFDLESTSTEASDILILSGGLETTSTSRFSNKVSLAANYNIRTSITSADSSKSEFTEHKLGVRVNYSPVNTVRFTFSNQNTLTTGSVTSYDATTRGGSLTIAQYDNPRNLSVAQIGTDSIHSVSTVNASWEPLPRLNTFISASEDVFKSSAIPVSTITDLSSGIGYSSSAWNFSNKATYTRGSRESLNNNSESVTDEASVRYVHSRALDGTIRASYTSEINAGTHRSEVEQRLNYGYFTTSGISRKLFEFSETAKILDGSHESNNTYNKSLMLGVKYYPIRQLTLAANAGYLVTDFKLNDYSLVYNAAVMANFKLLQASLDYTHGTRKSDNAIEDKLTGSVRRSF